MGKNIKNFFSSKWHLLKKRIYWNLPWINFGKQKNTFDRNIKYTVYTHQTPLLRQLKDVDMYLQYNKILNLKLAVKKLNNLVLAPRQFFSYWKYVQNPSKKKGYKEGMYLDQGKIKTAVGGGLCQLSNLIFWMSIHIPLEIIERWRHVYDVFPDSKRTQPFGSGATCAYPNIDLQFKNSSNQIFMLKLKVGDQFLKGRWLSNKPLKYKYKIVEKEHKIDQDKYGRYIRKNKLYKLKIEKNTKKILDEELIIVNNAFMMYEPLLGK